MDVVTGEIAGGVVMNAGCPALEELAADRKHARITNPTAESSLSAEGSAHVASGVGWIDGRFGSSDRVVPPLGFQ